MCGIAGVFNFDQQLAEKELLLTMATALKHRGPDEMTSFIDGQLGFGFSRLSIIDVLHGHQPFFGLDNSVVLICNGEIFNYKELRFELEQKGHYFKTNCDVEVIIHLYIEYGTNFLNKLNGQFAFALYDKRENSLFLARDQFGICPLFYTMVDNVFVFGSEIKAILKHPKAQKFVELEGLDQVFTFPGLVSPVTMFKNISSLPAGNYMIVKDHQIKIRQYWDLIYPAQEENDIIKPESFYADHLEYLLLRSVEYRLSADVPVGFYLSGGLDSSLIGAMIKKSRPNNDYTSFSIGFPGNTEMNELHYQQRVVEHLGIINKAIMFEDSEIESRLKSAVWSSEGALKETYNTCSLALSEAVNKEGIKVILSGEGADELLGGYVGYRLDKLRGNNAVKSIDDLLEDNVRNLLWGDSDLFYEKNYYEFAEIKTSIYSSGVRETFSKFDAVKGLVFDKTRLKNKDAFQKRSYIDLKLRLSDHLVSDHCDRVTYANSIEGRYPFLDIDLVEFIKTIPSSIKLNDLTEKYILKKVAGKYLPEPIINRQKFGFVAPGSPSLLRQNIEWVNDLLSFEQIKRQGYFDPNAVEYLKKKYSADNFKLNLPFDSDLLIVILTFNIFLELFEMPDFS